MTMHTEHDNELLREAIAHAWQVAEQAIGDCGAEHKRLALWLDELHLRREGRGSGVIPYGLVGAQRGYVVCQHKTKLVEG